MCSQLLLDADSVLSEVEGLTPSCLPAGGLRAHQRAGHLQ